MTDVPIQSLIDHIKTAIDVDPWAKEMAEELLKERELADKYEYHYDHTDCIWYDGTYHNPCPSTCSQYRDGWSDAMNYIFKDGKGYQPYKRR